MKRIFCLRQLTIMHLHVKIQLEHEGAPCEGAAQNNSIKMFICMIMLIIIVVKSQLTAPMSSRDDEGKINKLNFCYPLGFQHYLQKIIEGFATKMDSAINSHECRKVLRTLLVAETVKPVLNFC
ncbi:CLUMA_CG001334, isoform A [Clunio marinus]|uniref:CLUMA_CG001334, isoform A n=1 Tax=Clunio marinus TaxID=568069 RepID=A0A1J1HM56_9DIPT|nr:CLUMA_CG001334, isoform A [Clunio marinus]